MPPLWMEWGSYIGGLLLFAAGIVTGSLYFYAGVTAMFLYWNYKLFAIIREYVRHVNTTEFSRLLTIIAQNELNKHEDGTFQDSSCLTQEQDDETEEARSSSEGD